MFLDVMETDCISSHADVKFDFGQYYTYGLISIFPKGCIHIKRESDDKTDNVWVPVGSVTCANVGETDGNADTRRKKS